MSSPQALPDEELRRETRVRRAAVKERKRVIRQEKRVLRSVAEELSAFEEECRRRGIKVHSQEK